MVKKALSIVPVLLVLLCIGCGHMKVQNVGLISLGNIEGKSLPNKIEGPVLTGTSAGHQYFLSNAVRDALKDSEYDTLVDVEIKTETGLFIWSNKIIVAGTALNSETLLGNEEVNTNEN